MRVISFSSHAHPVCATPFKGMTALGTDLKSVPKALAPIHLDN
jgi:hypothetical protein